MLVPPGVGRRKREASHEEDSRLILNNTHLLLKYGKENMVTYSLPQVTSQAFIDEIPLGILVTLNAWHLAEAFQPKENVTCLARNFCELGLNCATFGTGSQLTCTFGAQTMSRWLSQNGPQEKEYLDAFYDGVRLRNCQQLHETSCPVWIWNQFIAQTKRQSLCSN